MEFAEFIRAHDGDDLASLALARERYADSVSTPPCAGSVSAFDLALSTLEVRRKLRSKVPSWYAVPSLRYPLRLSGEQCSSEETARYKAAVALEACPHGRLADLTGGLGVDSWAFAQRFKSVLYNEMRPELASAAAENFIALGLTNVRVRNCALAPGDARSEPGMTVQEILGDFKPDIIYMDPARRASDGRKVFRLEDCQPDVLKLLPELLGACPLLLLKLSPMADITLVCRQLGCVEAVHVVAADGECKELLLLLRRGHEGPYSTTIYESGSVAELDRVQGMSPELDQVQGIFGLGPKSGWTRSTAPVATLAPASGAVLFEPGKALLKAGAFAWPCGFGLEKLGRHTHLYIGPEVPEELKPFGKTFRILEVLPLNKRSIKDIGARYPQASVTARNIPLTSDELRKKLGVKDGGTVHIFGVHTDAAQENMLVVCAAA